MRILFQLAAVCVVWLSAAWSFAKEPVDYQQQVKPMLRQRCFACHAALKQEAGLRLDTVASMLGGGDSGAVIVRGKPDKSLILKRITAMEIAERMPPEHEGEPLGAAQIKLLRQWIAEGATAPSDEQPEADPGKHWAFQPIVRPAAPQVENTAWSKNPVDAFLSQRHQQLGLTPQPQAPRALLLRRLHLDLLGLPPTIEEIAAFEGDTSPDWYERKVDQLLDDPRHGERWARHWMDIWRHTAIGGVSARSFATANGICGTFEIGLSSHSTRIGPTTKWCG